MSRIHKSIEVNVPVRTAYNQWTQFEEFPKFMQGVVEVEQLDDTHVHWVAQIAGRRKEWDAEITEQVPDRRIVWRAQQGTPNAGMVSFESVHGHTRIDLEMRYDPQNLAEQVGDILGLASRQVESDLKRFKEFIESRGEETGAWRGQVPPA
ncbi:MAG: SRPBCC family protein [Dehalococcoidia bacterium]|nr:SRPBCC family protein [Dehalococcoidia bacterium]